MPVQCGKKHGTAFFVSPTQMLTAWHVVSEGVRNRVPVYCTYKSRSIVCEIVEIDKLSDVVLLTVQNYTHSVWIELLSLPYNIDKPKALAGYPLEIGFGQDMFDFPIHHAQQVTGREYDVVASPQEIIPFHSYKGFSGSPIVTEDGMAVGVVTDQLCSVIGYTSVCKIREHLKAKGVPVVTDWEKYDTSAYGYARSRLLVEEQINAAGDRYSPDEHVDSEALNKDFGIFCRKKEHDRYDFNQVGQHIESWYLDMRTKYNFINTRYDNGDYSMLRPALGDLREKIASNDPSLQAYKAITTHEKKELNDRIAQLNAIFHSPQDTLLRCAFISGAAGTGKTHFLCRLAQVHDIEYQTYLLFGSQFRIGESLDAQIEQLLEFPEGLKGLNAYMVGKERYAVIIIDALNEGAGFAYWTGEVNKVPDLADKYPYIRFILSSRIPIPSNFISDEKSWMMRSLEGSIDPVKLRDAYFSKYGVDPYAVAPNIYEFSKPLFLRIFCVSYKRIPIGKRGNISKLDLFEIYLNERNKKVVDVVDVDPYKNVTKEYLDKLANYSLYYGYCGDVSRDKARMYSNQVCCCRLWKKSLLYACLQENLLLESFDRDGNHSVEFEYENIGDYLRAFTLLKSKRMDAEDIDEWLHDQKRKIETKRLQRTKFTHTVGAMLSLPDNKTNYFVEKALKVKEWDAELLDTLQYRGPHNKAIVSKFLQEGNIKIVSFLIRDVDEYGSDIVEGLHQTLKDMGLPERDRKWSAVINELYDWNGRESFQGKRELVGSGEEDMKKLAVLLTWMLSSSYPELRAIIVRELVDLFSEAPDVANHTCTVFAECNDHYVTEGLYCAVYGMALRIRNKDVLSGVGKVVYDLNYAETKCVPNNLMVRMWTMKILERVSTLVQDFGYWNEIRPPFETGDNPFEQLTQVGAIDEDYFGNSNGSHLLFYSLFKDSDFNRYVIGTNNNVTDRLLVFKNTNEEVRLDDIAKMVGLQVMKLGWNDNLGNIDNGKYSDSRFDNEKERIGKKYQWMAYYDIMGQLTDCCYLRKGRYGEKHGQMHDVNYPWYTDVKNYFDPTLQAVDKERVGVFFENEEERLPLNQESLGWYDDDTKLPQPKLALKDTKGQEWVLMCGFDVESHQQGEVRKSKSLYVNSAFVRREDAVQFGEWAKDQNYYGRWMPEHHDNIDFRWNEYPWADSYKQSLESEQWERPTNGNCPADVMVSYKGQLQEDVKGFNADKDFRPSVYMPCEDMMVRLGLFNAERGIIRKDENNKVVGLDYGLTGDNRTGMLMKKEVLDKYLQETGYTLFWFVLGEKTQSGSGYAAMKDLTGCWKYNLDEGFVGLQKMKVAESHHS